MKRELLFIFIVLTGITASAFADPLLDRADALNQKGGVENQKKTIDLCLKAVEVSPSSYEANWKLARACAYYTLAAQEHLVDGWEKECKIYGKLGMGYAQKAIALEPDKPDGHYFFGFNAGMYSYGVTILKAIAEGLKEKAQESFEKVYAMDKNYEEGAVLISLGRFWHQLPWPLKDKKQSLKYYREYENSPLFRKDPNAMVFVADLLADLNDKKNRNEAKAILDEVMGSCGPYYQKIADDVVTRL